MLERVRREVATLRSSLETLAPGSPWGPATVFVLGTLCLWLYDWVGSTSFFTHEVARRFFPHLSPADLEAGSYLYWFASAFPLLFLLPVLVAKLAGRIDPKSGGGVLGLTAGDWRFGLSFGGVFYLVMVPILFAVVRTSDFQDYYPLYGQADRSARMFLLYEAAYFLYFVAWEFFFRGFLTSTLQPTLKAWVIFVQAVPFACMHFGKPPLESGSAVLGGIALGWLAWRTRSIWYGVIAHGLTAVTLDLMVVAVKHGRHP